jgi:tetratricopeptide (TPR) repeat protein
MPEDDRFHRARSLAVSGRPKESLAALDEVLAADPDHLGALQLKAGLLLEAREGEEALAVYERAARAWPRSAEAWNGLARGLHALGRDRDALAAAEAARGLLGEGGNALQTAPVYLTLVWCLRELRLFKEALAAAEEGLAAIPDAVLAQYASLVEQELAEAEKEEC